MAESNRQPARDLSWVIGWLALLWTVGILDWWLKQGQLPGGLAPWLGVRPREIPGLVGILTAPLIHKDFTHLAVNSIELFFLGYIACAYGRKPAFAAVVVATLCGGLLTWVAGQDGNHIGASGVCFGLVGFVVANAIVRIGLIEIALALLVVGLYGSAVVAGLLPDEHGAYPISWTMHLGGLVGGLLTSWRLRPWKRKQ